MPEFKDINYRAKNWRKSATFGLGKAAFGPSEVVLGVGFMRDDRFKQGVEISLPDARKLRDYLNENLPDAPTDEEIIDQARVLVAADDHTFVDGESIAKVEASPTGYFVSAKVYVPADSLTKKGAR